MKQSCHISLFLIFLLIFAASCKQPNVTQVEEGELIELIQEMRASLLNYPDSFLLLLDAIWVENEHSMTNNEKVEFYNQRGRAFLSMLENETAEDNFLKALQYLEKLNDGDVVRQAQIMHNRAIIRKATGDLQEAIEMSQQARSLIGNHPEPELLSHVYSLKGTIFSLMGEIDSALYSIQLSIDIVEDENFSERQAVGLANLGILFLDLEKFSQAEENLRNAILIFTELDHRRALSGTYHNLAVVLMLQDRMEEGLFYARKSDKIAVAGGMPPRAMAIYYTRQGEIYLEENKYYNSLTMFHQALDLVKQAPDVRMIAIIENSIGEAYRRMGDLDKALLYMNSALQTAQENRLSHLEFDIQRNFVYLHAARGDMDSFAMAMAAERALRDNLFEEQSNRALHEMQVRYETELREAQIAKQEEELIRKQITITFLLFAFVVFIAAFVSYTLFQQNARIVQQYETILKLKKETKHNNEDIDRLLKLNKISDKLLLDIEHLFNEEKIYLRPNLSIDDVAKMLNTNRDYLSIIINEHYQKSFPGFVNTFRIDDAIEMFKESREGGKYANYTIQAIGEEVGFKGKTTFFNTFKQTVGVAPSEYLKALKKK